MEFTNVKRHVYFMGLENQILNILLKEEPEEF